MTVTIERLAVEHRYRHGRGELTQQFRFTGTSAADVTRTLMTAPLIGPGSLFGSRPGHEGDRSDTSWRLHSFSPVAGFVFDVRVTASDGTIVAHFDQPDRATPYLHGDALWTISEHGSNVIFDEQINTAAASEVVEEPLGGAGPSLRRRLFFTVGHPRVMNGTLTNLAHLLNNGGS